MSERLPHMNGRRMHFNPRGDVDTISSSRLVAAVLGESTDYSRLPYLVLIAMSDRQIARSELTVRAARALQSIGFDSSKFVFPDNNPTSDSPPRFPDKNDAWMCFRVSAAKGEDAKKTFEELVELSRTNAQYRFVELIDQVLTIEIDRTLLGPKRTFEEDY